MPLHARKVPLSQEAFDVAVARIDEQLEHARASKGKLDERSREYKEVQSILGDLPHKLTHKVMVPFGPLGFFEGYLEHTNEVLTQLSSEWFVLRTIPCALRMVGRRQERLQRDQADVDRELEQLEMRRRVAVDEGASRFSSVVSSGSIDGSGVRLNEEGFLDIREPLAEDDNDDGYSMVRKPPDDTQAQSFPLVQPGTSTVIEGELAPAQRSCDDPILARLRELERMEELQRLEELDDLVEGYEKAAQPDASATPGADNLQQSPASMVQTPADIFQVMQRAEEDLVAAQIQKSAKPGNLRETQASAGRHGSMGISAGSLGCTTQVHGAPTFMATHHGVAGDIRERVGAEDMQAAVFAAPVTAQHPSGLPEANSVSASCSGSAQGKRVSKFKAERERAKR